MQEGNAAGTSNVLDIWRIARDHSANGRPFAIATVIDTWGSSPVPVGGQMAIFEDGTFQGSVSGGCVEADVIHAGCESIKSGRTQRLSFGVPDEKAWASGLPCGGNISVFVESMNGASGLQLADRLLRARSERRTIFVETNLTTGEQTIRDDFSDFREPLASMFRTGHSGLLKLGEHEIFAHTIAPNPRLLIIGATHIAQALVAIASTLSLTPIVIDPRESFASQTRFAETEIRHGWPNDMLTEIGLDKHTAVIALAHIDHIDDEALACALKSSVRYIGALGSTRNHEKRKARLKEAGFAEAEIDRIHCPIGLDIGAVTPEEIALAIAAEVILTFRGRKRK